MVDVEPTMKAILAATGRLSALSLPPDAPPAFLLDWGRRWSIDPPAPGRFDNRSVSFVTDFPSANLLLSQSIRQAVVIQSVGDQPQADLAHTLRRWQAGGIEIRLKRLEEPGPPAACVVGKPSRFDILVGRFLALLGLRRNPLGGFGGTLPAPSSG